MTLNISPVLRSRSCNLILKAVPNTAPVPTKKGKKNPENIRYGTILYLNFANPKPKFYCWFFSFQFAFSDRGQGWKKFTCIANCYLYPYTDTGLVSMLHRMGWELSCSPVRAGCWQSWPTDTAWSASPGTQLPGSSAYLTSSYSSTQPGRSDLAVAEPSSFESVFTNILPIAKTIFCIPVLPATDERKRIEQFNKFKTVL